MAAELEMLLLDHPAVVDVAAVGVSDARLGERVGVCVVVTEEARGRDPEQLRRQLVEYLDRRQVAKFKWPEHLLVLDQLPRTAINKVKKNELRALLEGTDDHQTR